MIDKIQELWNRFLYKLMFKNYRESDTPVKQKVKKSRKKGTK